MTPIQAGALHATYAIKNGFMNNNKNPYPVSEEWYEYNQGYNKAHCSAVAKLSSEEYSELTCNDNREQLRFF